MFSKYIKVIWVLSNDRNIDERKPEEVSLASDNV